MDRAYIRNNYLRTWFAIDVVSTLPYEWMVNLEAGFVQMFKVRNR